MDHVFLHPIMKSVLQPVDVNVGRFFKCAFRRSLVEHILNYVDANLILTLEERNTFKIIEAVIPYDGIRSMKQALT